MTKAHHVHYDHYRPEMARRLDGFYGRVDAGLNDQLASEVVGKSVLDIGCGFGGLTEHLRAKGFEATGIDLLHDNIKAGRERYPLADLRLATSEEPDFPDASFDTIVLKDTIHHIYEEGDVAAFMKSLRRIARRRLLILDPNPMGVLLAARKLIGHVDPVCSPMDATRVLESAGFRVSKVKYLEPLAFALSGGYVGPVLVPKSPRFIGSALLALDAGLNNLFTAGGVGRFVCWRYLLVADVDA